MWEAVNESKPKAGQHVSLKPPPHHARDIYRGHFNSGNAANVFNRHSQKRLKTHQSPAAETLGCALGLRVNHMIILKSSFSKSHVLKVFSIHSKTQSRRLRNPPLSNSVLELLYFRDGLVWAECLTTLTQL